VSTNLNKARPVFPALLIGILQLGGLIVPGLLSPVTAAPRAITVTLPDSMTPAQFDHEFDEAVRAAAISPGVGSSK